MFKRYFSIGIVVLISLFTLTVNNNVSAHPLLDCKEGSENLGWKVNC